ncbi:TauD/TfdA family dioxygenase [Paraburkholderia sp.]|uniref:TauD/TfdA family dioxygenase n=1 Tax=Paraburkholderia sp. TaxID=1926495 RepID=UPI0023989D7B|nr:TauD/TfdA family dioxygenase [Paraburkholderia sp.]MDE1182642.1 TauD/TfdA family dioxygenase [Paraburkholderia sp.]
MNATLIHDASVETSFLDDAGTMPLVLKPVAPIADLSGWIDAHRDQLETWLLRHGAVLFRDFGLTDPAAFEAFAETISPGLYGEYGDLPKKEGGRNTYRSTPYPEKQMILYHNESAHQPRWPRRQFFFCELPSAVGGATPIVDCRAMLRQLPAQLVDTFERRQLMYVRTFTRGLDVPWREFFDTEERRDVEARCDAAGIQYEWLPNDELQTRTVCPAVIVHPRTGERSFFNQVQLHHTGCLDDDVRLDLLDFAGAQRMPRQAYFGDGSEIDDATIATIGAAYERCAVRFAWQAGDVLMLDNMLVAHARDPYKGPRKIVVAMSELVERSQFAEAASA